MGQKIEQFWQILRQCSISVCGGMKVVEGWNLMIGFMDDKCIVTIKARSQPRNLSLKLFTLV